MKDESEYEIVKFRELTSEKDGGRRDFPVLLSLFRLAGSAFHMSS